MSDYLNRLDEEGQDFLKRIRSSAQQMKRVLDDMSHLVKTLSRPVTKYPTPLKEIVEEVIHKHNFAVEEGGVRVDVADDLPVVNVDAEKMRDALSAVFSNALYFTERPKGERIVAFEGTPQGGSYRLTVRDNGIGIDPRYVQQVFELGGISKLEKSRGGGPGYGLYLAKRLVESQGGTLTVDSVPGEGSAFHVSIPS